MQCQITGQTLKERGWEGPKTKQEFVGRMPWATAFSSLRFWENNDEEVNDLKKKFKKKCRGRSLFPCPSAFFWRLHKEKAVWRLWVHPTNTSTTSSSSHLLFVNPPRCERRLIKQERMVGCTQTVRRAAKWLFSPRPSRFLNYCCHCGRYYYINNGNRVRLQPLCWAPRGKTNFFCYSIWLCQISVWHVFFLSLFLSLSLSSLCLKLIFDDLCRSFLSFCFFLGLVSYPSLDLYISLKIHQVRRKKKLKNKCKRDFWSWYRTTQVVMN